MEYSREEILDITDKARIDCDDIYLPIIRKFNQKFIGEFQDYLKNEGYSLITINNHLEKMDIFLNGFLTHQYENNVFTGYESFFALKTYMEHNSTDYDAKDIIATLNKFYLFMYEAGYIDQEEYKTAKICLDD